MGLLLGTNMKIWTVEEVDRLNRHQNNGCFHPYTCDIDGDTAHVQYEFEQLNYNGTLEQYKQEGIAKGYSNPLGALTETKLVATEEGWKCPVCNYKQTSVMAEILSPIFEEMFLENERYMARIFKKAEREVEKEA